jgi:hypothetical protein
MTAPKWSSERTLPIFTVLWGSAILIEARREENESKDSIWIHDGGSRA